VNQVHLSEETVVTVERATLWTNNTPDQPTHSLKTSTCLEQ